MSMGCELTEIQALNKIRGQFGTCFFGGCVGPCQGQVECNLSVS